VNAHRFIALEDKYESMVAKQHHKVHPYLLKLDEHWKKNLLTHAIETSDRLGMGEIYNTLFDSCATNAMDLLDRSGPINRPRKLIELFQHFPNKAPLDLWVRGLRYWTFWTHKHRPPLLEEDMKNIRRNRARANVRRACKGAFRLLS